MDQVSSALKQENRRIRHLRICVDLVIQLILSGQVSAEEAEKCILGVRNLASGYFPGKEYVFDMLYIPRFRRAYLETGAVELPDVLR